MQMWLVRPAKKMVAGAALLALTYLAGALRPQLLHAANGIGIIDDAKRPIFLDYRLFILSIVVFSEFIFGYSLTALLAEEDPEFSSLPSIVMKGLVPLTMFMLIALGALQIWISARCSKTPLTMSQSMKVSGYGIGVALITLLLVAPLVAVSVSLFFEIFPSISTTIQYIFIASILVLSYLIFAYLQFVGPVSSYYPSASRSKLFLGWFMGYLLPLWLLILVVVFLLVMSVVYISSLG